MAASSPSRTSPRELFALERQRWLAGLTLLLAVPLPLTGIVTWPVTGIFAAVAAAVLLSRRVLKGAPNWVENVLAPFVVVIVVMAGGLRFGILRPVAHLAVLVAAVRLPGCGRADRMRSYGALLSLVGVAGIASSTHVALVAYMAVLLAVVVTAVGRLQLLGLAESVGGGRRIDWPPRQLVVASVLISFAVATPLFALLPRLRSPFAAAPMTGGAVSGFRETVSLNNIRSIQMSRARALHVALEKGEEPGGEWLRLVGATTQNYRGGLWAQGHKGRERLMPNGSGQLVLADGLTSRASLMVTVEKPSDRIFVPAGATRLMVMERIPFWRDGQGSLGASRRLEAPFKYRVEFDPEQVTLPPPNDGDLELPQELSELGSWARELTAGATNATAAANRLEEYLRTEYGYTLEWPLDAPFQQDPVAWFLFEGKRGHCEFFASALAMLLRSIDIPARLQTGYLGGDPDGAGGWVVRDANAHAWVVAFVDGRWRVFDPTPAAGRPAFVPSARLRSWQLTWLRLEDAWDRWVLTFSLVDQLELFRRGWERIAQGWRQAVRLLIVVAIVGGVLVTARVIGRRWRREVFERVPRNATARALARVRREVVRRGWGGAGITPRSIGAEVARRCPAARQNVLWLVASHEAVRYGGKPSPSAAEVRRQLRSTLRCLARIAES